MPTRQYSGYVVGEQLKALGRIPKNAQVSVTLGDPPFHVLPLGIGGVAVNMSENPPGIGNSTMIGIECTNPAIAVIREYHLHASSTASLFIGAMPATATIQAYHPCVSRDSGSDSGVGCRMFRGIAPEMLRSNHAYGGVRIFLGYGIVLGRGSEIVLAKGECLYMIADQFSDTGLTVSFDEYYEV